jgi:DNA transformation protein
MFGGVGLYAGDLFFALIAGDVLYLKADKATHDARVKAGARPFPFPDRPKGKGRMQYYSVPAAIVEDAEALPARASRAGGRHYRVFRNAMRARRSRSGSVSPY